MQSWCNRAIFARGCRSFKQKAERDDRSLHWIDATVQGNLVLMYSILQRPVQVAPQAQRGCACQSRCYVASRQRALDDLEWVDRTVLYSKVSTVHLERFLLIIR